MNKAVYDKQNIGKFVKWKNIIIIGRFALEALFVFMPNSNVDLRDSDTSFGTEGRRNRSYNVDFLLFVDFFAYKFRGVWDPDMMDTESFFSSHTRQRA